MAFVCIIASRHTFNMNACHMAEHCLKSYFTIFTTLPKEIEHKLSKQYFNLHCLNLSIFNGQKSFSSVLKRSFKYMAKTFLHRTIIAAETTNKINFRLGFWINSFLWAFVRNMHCYPNYRKWIFSGNSR